jgi:hypothetical protein
MLKQPSAAARNHQPAFDESFDPELTAEGLRRVEARIFETLNPEP